MLDDLKYIHEKDTQDALGVAEKQWQQLAYEYQTAGISFDNIQNVVLAGMGGSALGAVFVQSWPDLPVPFEIVRSYSLPGYVNEQTLVIVSSYSGNTEETLTALEDAASRRAKIVVISNGGTLSSVASQKNYPLIKIPDVPQPRMSAFYIFSAVVQILTACKIAPDVSTELNEAGKWLGGQVQAWRADVATNSNLAKQIALELAGKTVIIYSGPLMFPAANKWKIWINENAKNLAWANQYPEFNHNEFIGWSSHPVDKPFAVVELRSNLEHPKVQKRFAATERLLSGKRPEPIVVEPQGETMLQQLLWAANLGDFVSIYLALLNGLNPTPVDLVEKLKVILKDEG